MKVEFTPRARAHLKYMAVVLNLALGVTISHAEPSVFGEDHRTSEFGIRNQPANSVGLVFGENGGECTGTLIAADLVLTNEHCVKDVKTSIPRAIEKYNFFPGMHPRELAKPSVEFLYVAYRVLSVQTWGSGGKWNKFDLSKDFAILKLEAAVGTPFRPAPLYAGKMEKLVGKKAILIGYSGDKMAQIVMGMGNFKGQKITMPKPTMDSHCSIKGYKSGVILHDCDATPGASGAALFVQMNGGFQIAGIHSRSSPYPVSYSMTKGEILNKMGMLPIGALRISPVLFQKKFRSMIYHLFKNAKSDVGAAYRQMLSVRPLEVNNQLDIIAQQVQAIVSSSRILDQETIKFEFVFSVPPGAKYREDIANVAVGAATVRKAYRGTQ